MTFDGQLSLTLDGPPAAPGRASIEDRFVAFDRANPHVFALLLRLARERLDRPGVLRIGVKELWEQARVHVETERLGDAYRLNNDYTAAMARKLIRVEPRLVGVMRVRGGQGG